jgi:glutaredoxin
MLKYVHVLTVKIMSEPKNKTVQNILLIVVVAIVALGLVWLITKEPSYSTNETADNTTSTLSLYYRADCAHCQNVDKFMQENNVTATIPVEMKEVMENIKNNNELMVRAANCGYDLSSVGVPMLYDRGTCYSGDEEIINYFKGRLNK